MSGGLPGSIDDLKAMLLDLLAVVQKYVRDSETDAWDAFWEKASPRDENTCRNRLIDFLRPRTRIEVALLPETQMPELNRTDIFGIYKGWGVPIEVKGQWHPDVWDASTVQLSDKYGRDWRALGRGIYLVLWFGKVAGKNLRRHPDGLLTPKTPSELRSMLEARLTAAERSRIDIVVLDVSSPATKPKHKTKPRRMTKTAKPRNKPRKKKSARRK